MKHILIVDDDAVVLRMYQDALTQHGFEVTAASDGIAGIQRLRAQRPDLVVCDLMMPKFTGVDVLRFIRSQPHLADLPVVVLSNSYMNDLAEKAVAIGVQQALLKLRCTPQLLIGLINDLLAGKPVTLDPSDLLAIPQAKQKLPPAAQPVSESVVPPAPEDKIHADARRDLTANTAKIRSDLQGHVLGLNSARNEVEMDLRLQNFYRRVHFLTAAAGLAGYQSLALMASAFEALLFELMNRPALLTPSVRRTLAFTTDYLNLLLQRAAESAPLPPPAGRVLIVDDDPLSTRLIAAALRHAQLQPRSTEQPLTALQWVQEDRFDLILLDIEMPDMDGFELCRQIRVLPGYRRTPVIFVTTHGDFNSRAQSALSGGNDLIAKPVLPIELAVKAVMHLIQGSAPDGPAASN